MAAKYSDIQTRVLLALTDAFQRAGDLGIEEGLYRLHQMGLIEQRFSVACKNCGHKRSGCSCSDGGSFAQPKDTFVRLTPRGLEERQRLRDAAMRDDKISFLDKKDAVAHCELQCELLAGTRLLAYCLEKDGQWFVTAKQNPPAGAVDHLHFMSKQEIGMSEKEETPNLDNLGAPRFAASDRGRWLISRALVHLLDQLVATKSEDPQDTRDINDLRRLIDAYPGFSRAREAGRQAAAGDGSDDDWLAL